MSSEYSAEFSRVNVPQSDGSVPAPAGECRAIGAERNAVDGRHFAGEGFAELSGVNIPQSDGAVPTLTGECRAVGVERNTRDGFRMP